MFWFREDEEIEDSLLDRINKIMSYLKPPYIDYEEFYVYHGTPNNLHDTSIANGSTFTTISFLSTTRKIKVAHLFARSFDVNVSYIYVLKIKNIPFINLLDDYLNEIILPFGITFRVINSIKYYSSNGGIINIIICECDTYIQLSIINQLKYPTIDEVNFSNVSTYYSDSDSTIEYIINNLKVFYNSRTKESFKIVVTRPITVDNIKPSFNQIFRRIINEALSSYIYKTIYDINAIEFELAIFSHNTKQFCLKSRDMNHSKLSRPSEYLMLINEYLIDCIMCNSDGYVDNNIVICDKKSFRMNVSGCMRYLSYGMWNQNFSNENPNDHVEIPKLATFKNVLVNAFINPNPTINIKIPAKIDENAIGELNELINDKDFNIIYISKYKFINTAFAFPVVLNIKNSNLSNGLKQEYIKYILETFMIIAIRNNYYNFNGNSIINELIKNHTTNVTGGTCPDREKDDVKISSEMQQDNDFIPCIYGIDVDAILKRKGKTGGMRRILRKKRLYS